MKLKRNICQNRWLTRTPAGVLAAILLFAPSVLLQSCFTGIESTPKITYKDVRRQNAGESPEQEFAGHFQAVPFSGWRPGRQFLVADARAIYTYSAPARKSVGISLGDTLVYRGVREMPSITGGEVAELIFTSVSHPLTRCFTAPEEMRPLWRNATISSSHSLSTWSWSEVRERYLSEKNW